MITNWLSLGESFATLYQSVNGHWEAHSWFLPSTDLENGIRKALQSCPQVSGPILVTTRMIEMAIKKRIGDRVALVVTEGFEEWPRIRQPLLEKNLSSNPSRGIPLVDQELVFGVTERIDRRGKILKEVDETDVAMILSKLELMEVKKVAIGLLHSNANSIHESKLKKIFEGKGIEVVCSHEVKTPGNEVARWWRAYLNSFLAPNFDEIQSHFKKLSKEFPVEFYFTDCQGNEFQGVQSRYLDTQFGHQYLLSNGLNNSACLYLGIEEFSIIEEARSDQPWKTEIGPIGVESKRFIELPIQPTSKLSTSRLGMGTLCSPASGYEPGPVVFGRSLYPMTIDVIQHVCGDVLPDPVKSLSKPSMERKIDEGVASFFQHEFNDRKEQVQFLFEEIISQISFALLKHPSSKFTVKGAFGRALCPAIQERLNGAKTIIEVSDGIL